MLAKSTPKPYCDAVEKEYKQPMEIIKNGEPQERAAFIAATALTLARPLIAGFVSHRGIDKKHEWTASDATQLAGAYLTDMEGSVARLGNAQTEFGAKIDPIADKLATNPHEIVLATRGEDSMARVGIRLARDVAISGLRAYAKHATVGRAKTAANWSGKSNTLLRQSTNVFATSPLGKKHPTLRTSLQVASTALTIGSGIYTGVKLLQEVRRIKREDRQASRE